MNFFQKIRNIAGFRNHPAVLAISKGNLSIFEKLLFFNDQGIFSLLFFGSLLLHVMLVIIVSMISDFLKPEPPPIRAKIGVRYAELPVKATPVINFKKRSASAFVRPVSAARASIRSAFVIVFFLFKD